MLSGGSELLITDDFFQLVVGPLLSIIHVYSVVEEMRAAPVNTLNPQRTAMLVADFLKVCFELSSILVFPIILLVYIYLFLISPYLFCCLIEIQADGENI